MRRATKFVPFMLVFAVLSLAQVSAQLDISTDGDHLNADGDTLEVDYSDVEGDISEIQVLVDGSNITYSENPVESIDVEYEERLSGGENLSIRYQKDNRTVDQNIKYNLTRYQGNFEGFYDEEVKAKNEITRQLYYRELDSVLAEVEITQTDGNNTWNPEGLLGRDFEVVSKVDNATAELRLESRSRNPYSFSFDSVPNMEVGKKEFMLKMDNGPALESFTIQKRAAFEGRIQTKSGPGEGEFELVDDSISKFQTNKDGYFFKLLDSSELDRDVQLNLGEVSTTFGDINIRPGTQENIKYEFYRGLDPSNVQTDKLLKPQNVIAFSSNYPIDIDETSVEMNYNTSNIEPSNVEVYECKYWDFYGEECRATWNEKQDVENQELLGKVKIKDLETEGDGEYGLKSAYMVAVPYTRPSLELKEELSLQKSEFNIEDSIVIESNIVNNKTGKPVEDALIQVEMSRNGKYQNESALDGEKVGRTNEEGFFTFPPIEVPNNSGNYTLKLEAGKKSYNNLSYKYGKDIKISETKEIELKGSDKEAKPGERVTTVFNLENTGQATVKNIKVKETSGISSNYYTLNPRNIDKLEQGSSSSLTLMSILPKDFCEGGCKADGFKISVEGSANGVKLSDKTSINIARTTQDSEQDKSEKELKSQDVTESNASTDDKANEDKGSEEILTGKFLESETGRTIGLMSLLIPLIAALIFVRRKSNSAKGTEDISRPVIEDSENQESQRILVTKNAVNVEKKLEESSEGVCPDCGKEFDTSAALKLHLNHLH